MAQPSALDLSKVLTVAVLVAVALFGSILISSVTWDRALLISIGMLICTIAFLRTQAALYFLITAMLLSPELILGGTENLSSFQGRGVTLRGDDLLIVLIGITWLIKSAIHKELGLISRSPLNPAIFFYTAACLLSTLVGVLQGNVEASSGALFVLKYIEYFILYYIVLNNVTELRQTHGLLTVTIATGFIVAIIAILQTPRSERVSLPFEGTHGEPNTLGGYLLLMIMILLGIFVFHRGKRSRWVFLGLALLLGIPFMFSLSRSSYLGLIPALFVLMWMSRNRMFAVAVILIGAALFLNPNLIPTAVKKRIEYTYSHKEGRAVAQLFGARLDPSTSARLASFEVAIDAFQERPVLGWGVTGWRFIDSMYLRTLVELGLIGLAVFTLVIVGCFKIGFRAAHYFKDYGLYRGLATGYIAGLVGLLFHAVGSNTFIIVRIMEPFWLLTGILTVLPAVAAHEGVIPYDDTEPQSKAAETRRHGEILVRPQRHRGTEKNTG